ncbi:hypothetical protein AGMMS49992_26310 [Clostridia bacterium]|nr:hypothetical protein AGMMS49992_26310 [Clostridia bacterium]
MSVPYVPLPDGVLSGREALTLIPSFNQLSRQLTAQQDALNALLKSEQAKLELAADMQGPMFDPSLVTDLPTFGDMSDLAQASGETLVALAEMSCQQNCRFWLSACLETILND